MPYLKLTANSPENRPSHKGIASPNCRVFGGLLLGRVEVMLVDDAKLGFPRKHRKMQYEQPDVFLQGNMFYLI